MKLYTDEGWLDFDTIDNLKAWLVLIVGGRAIGKTYGAIKKCFNEGRTFCYMRRRQAQIDNIKNPLLSPFQPVAEDMDLTYDIRPLGRAFHGLYLNEHEQPDAYLAALSSISGLRGFNVEAIQTLIFDEFIPETHETLIKDEAGAFFNAYETINRNRELKGRKPLQVWALANANDLGNPLFLQLGLVRAAEKMKSAGIEFWQDPERGIALIFPDNSPISQAKQETALYKLMKGTDFFEMAIGNDFAGDKTYSTIKSKALKEYRLICTLGEISFYQHKSRAEYYCSKHCSGQAPIYGTSKSEIKRFMNNFPWLYQEYLRDTIIFEEHLCEILLTKYYNLV